VRLLLDEMLSPQIAEQLRTEGHDVEAVNGDPEREGLAHPDVLDLARSERRALVTNNVVDFRPLHHEAIAPGGPGHFGMVFMPGNYRRTKADVGRIVTALRSKLGEYPGETDLANGETWL
jgi:predicted nuclease of predicted toxin-antitoxin system